MKDYRRLLAIAGIVALCFCFVCADANAQCPNGTCSAPVIISHGNAIPSPPIAYQSPHVLTPTSARHRMHPVLYPPPVVYRPISPMAPIPSYRYGRSRTFGITFHSGRRQYLRPF